jgi:CRP/FNR family cyclic AMP-dependent transcriptional regulator
MDALRVPAEHAFHAKPRHEPFHSVQVNPMFHTPVETRFAIVDRLLAFGDRPLQFPADMDLCREQVPSEMNSDAMRFVAAARQSVSGHAFRPAFTTADWKRFSSFCIARRLPADYRVLIPGRVDRTLRFLVEGSLWQDGTASRRADARQPKMLLAGAIVGEDAVFSDAPCDLDVRTLEDSLVLELSLPRQKELTAACPAIAFELLRAAGAVIAARGRTSGMRAEFATN